MPPHFLLIAAAGDREKFLLVRLKKVRLLRGYFLSYVCSTHAHDLIVARHSFKQIVEKRRPGQYLFDDLVRAPDRATISAAKLFQYGVHEREKCFWKISRIRRAPITPVLQASIQGGLPPQRHFR